MSKAPIDITNVQGDILLDGLPKRHESFFFFEIVDSHVIDFAKSLKDVAKQITHSEQTKKDREEIANHKKTTNDGSLVNIAGANIAFSWQGLQKLSKVLAGDLGQPGDPDFEDGMKKHAIGDAPNPTVIGDPLKPGSTTEPDWEAPFSNPETLHGVLLVTGNNPQQVVSKLDAITRLWHFHTSTSYVRELATIVGKVRPGAEKGHEHFGFNDGISQPALKGIDVDPIPGSDFIDPGAILINRGENTGHPEWMTDGSFLAFRKLQQNVQDFHHFLVDAGHQLGVRSDLLGARFVGRWPSGCPIIKSPNFDNTHIAEDDQQVNDFEFDKFEDQSRCPMAAHIRKTYPRNDLGDKPNGEEVANDFRILRRGIPYGNEISHDPHGKRGLLFVCYQSTISKGFAFIQGRWVNNPNFVNPGVGLDPILGQHTTENKVSVTGMVKTDATKPLSMDSINRFVVPRGGEYFFSPSMVALAGILSDAKEDAKPKAEL